MGCRYKRCLGGCDIGCTAGGTRLLSGPAEPDGNGTPRSRRATSPSPEALYRAPGARDSSGSSGVPPLPTPRGPGGRGLPEPPLYRPDEVVLPGPVHAVPLRHDPLRVARRPATLPPSRTRLSPS